MPGLAILRVGQDGRVTATGGEAQQLFGNALGRVCHRVVGALDVLGRPICRADCARELLAGSHQTSERCGQVRGVAARLECRRVGAEVVILVEPHRMARLGPTKDLSLRERQSLALLADGLTGGEIAERLGLSASTVRTHLERARKRLNARSSAEAIAKWSGWSFRAVSFGAVSVARVRNPVQG